MGAHLPLNPADGLTMQKHGGEGVSGKLKGHLPLGASQICQVICQRDDHPDADLW